MNRSSISQILLLALLASSRAAAADAAPFPHAEATVAQLQAEMAAGRLTSEQLTRDYIQRILDLDQGGPGVNSVIEINPDAISMARDADAKRRRGIVLGPLHGIPVLLKDNIDTGDKEQTTAGSFALVGAPAVRDATVTANLRAGGAVILGKTNLSEWANFRSAFQSISGWSAVGGQTGNVPLGATGQKRPKNIPTDYTKFLDPNGLKGARLGLTRQGIDQISPSSINDAWEAAVAQIQAAGATVVDLDAANFSFPFSQGELLVLCFDF